MPTFITPAEYLGNAKRETQVHVVSPHPWFRLHSQMANSERLRDLYMVQGREPVRINSEDAKKRGIADGDLVELTNDRGTIICGAVLSDDIMPGVVSIYEGGWPQLDSKGRCNSGLINFITSSRRSSGLSQATSANTCLAILRKCEDPEGPNRAYEPPPIEVKAANLQISDEMAGLDRVQEAAGHADPKTTMSYDRRQRLLALAARYQVPIIEDDPYGVLRYEGRPLPSLYALDRHGTVIYLSTVSKMLFPGFRIGLIELN